MNERENASNPDLEEIRAAMQAEFKPLFPELQDVVINGRTMRAHEVLDIARKTMGGVADNEKGILTFVRTLLALNSPAIDAAGASEVHIATVYEDNDGGKHVQLEVKNFDELPVGMKLYARYENGL